MTHEEKRSWARLVLSVVTYGVYVAVVASRANGGPLAEVPYAAVLLWTVGGAIVAAVLVETVLAAVSPRASRMTDERDRQIGRLGDTVGAAFVGIGAVAAMLMAMAGWHRFWIANVIYLCFFLSALIGSVAKVAAYRGRVPQW